jgi:hypothetical protein
MASSVEPDERILAGLFGPLGLRLDEYFLSYSLIHARSDGLTVLDIRGTWSSNKLNVSLDTINAFAVP